MASWFLVCGVRPAGQLGLGFWPAGGPAGWLAGCEIAGRTKLAIVRQPGILKNGGLEISYFEKWLFKQEYLLENEFPHVTKF